MKRKLRNLGFTLLAAAAGVLGACSSSGSGSSGAGTVTL